MIRLPDRFQPDRPAIVRNRLASLMVHTDRYAFKGMARLAEDASVGLSALCRIAKGDRRPSYIMVTRIVGALEKSLGVSIDPRDVFTEDLEFRTLYPCSVCGCSGCLPPWAYDDNDCLREAFRGVEPGRWTEDTGKDHL